MDQKWKITLYEAVNGASPIKDFIESLEQKAQTKIYNTLELLKEFGTGLSAPHVKKLTGTNLWELRVLGADSVRIFYMAREGRNFLLLHGFQKKKQKTPLKEMKIAQGRLHEYSTRKD